MKTWPWIALGAVAFLPMWWHGDIPEPLSFYEMAFVHTRYGHPNSPESGGIVW